MKLQICAYIPFCFEFQHTHSQFEYLEFEGETDFFHFPEDNSMEQGDMSFALQNGGRGGAACEVSVVQPLSTFLQVLKSVHRQFTSFAPFTFFSAIFLHYISWLFSQHSAPLTISLTLYYSVFYMAVLSHGSVLLHRKREALF